MRLLALLLVLGASSALLVSPKKAWSSTETPTEQSQSERSTSASYQAAEKTLLRVQIVEDDEQAARRQAREDAAQEHEKSDREHQEFSDNVGRAQTAFAFITLFFLIATLVYTAQAAKAASKSVDVASNALDQTIVAANAAARSADAAEEAFGMEYRPWMLFDGFDTMRVNDLHWDGVALGKGLMFLPKVKNFGNVPALKVKVSVSLKATARNFTGEPDLSAEFRGGEHVFATGQSAPVQGAPIAGAEYDGFLKRELKIGLGLVCTYEGPSSPREYSSTIRGFFMVDRIQDDDAVFTWEPATNTLT